MTHLLTVGMFAHLYLQSSVVLAGARVRNQLFAELRAVLCGWVLFVLWGGLAYALKGAL